MQEKKEILVPGHIIMNKVKKMIKKSRKQRTTAIKDSEVDWLSWTWVTFLL